jgi:hypothetical protein
MVEQEAVNFEVAGSSPAVGAKHRYLNISPVSIYAGLFVIIRAYENDR